MPKSRILAILSLVALTFFLVACGNEEEEDPTPEPTVATEATIEPTETEAPTESTEPTEVATQVEESPAASPTVMATPVAESTPGTPANAAGSATPVNEAPSLSTISATFEFTGAEQRDYMMSDEGCIGIGEYSQLKPGAQVIVRDATGTVVDIANLEASGDTEGCSWSAEISVPDTEFVSISIPMVTEVWFDQSDLESGTLKVSFP